VGELAPEDIKIDEIERLFAVSDPGSIAKKKAAKEKKQETVQLLQVGYCIREAECVHLSVHAKGARSQNIEITLSRFQLPPAEVKRRLFSGDISGLDESKGTYVHVLRVSVYICV
jgi:hypothetical protein